MTLTNRQKRILKAKAHSLDPLVQIGKNGVTPEQIETIKTRLESHELIKIKFNDYKSQKEPLSKEITQKTGSELVSIIGNILIVYKRRTEPSASPE